MPALKDAPDGEIAAGAPDHAPTPEPEPASPRTTLRRGARAAFAFAILVLSVAISAGAVHVVTPGESLAVIAAKHNTTVAALAETNSLANPDLILVGQQLTIPGSERVHVVARGDSVGEIARTYGSSVAAIVNANGLRNANLIKIGQQLVIPGSGTNGGAAPLYHLVQRGESLATIAAKHGMSVEALAAANGIRTNSVIYEGTRLRLSPGPSYDAPAASSAMHVVAAGESLGELAARYDTTISRLVELNSLPNPNLIRIGQRLVVPGGAFQCPVPGGSFFNDWGFPRSGGRFHQGNDIFASNGSQVVAPVSGRVEQISGTRGGLQFWLYGDDGNLYIGTHMSSFGATGRVSAGTVVGGVGDSGNARGSRPHLHFEVVINGEDNINPYPLLVAACR
ncbi:MAG: LysM peptidoglycan-binding domain-containing protein [Acidimicrobiia bacterium]|nr:LysM peptidoglycan-binding domain-containing protein [Acidimicrobiia bacterium]